MIEKIVKGKYVLATIIRSSFSAPGIEFFTPPDSPQQLGYMNRPAGYKIDAHKHPQIEKYVCHSFETLIVRSGKVKVFIFDEHDELFQETVIEKGDIILLSCCGHGFEMMEDSELIEVKQGPFFGEIETVSLESAFQTTSV